MNTDMQPINYFKKQYGHTAGLTVLHRMRTWYNQQARQLAVKNKTIEAQRMAFMADSASARIKAY